MTRISIGDMAQGYVLRHQNSQLKTDMNRLVQELASGRTADPARHLSGSYSHLADIERRLALLEGYGAAAAEAGVLTSSMQNALETFQSLATELGSAAISAAGAHLPEAVATAGVQARGDFARMLSTLNTSVAGRSLFSGTAVDQPALATSDVFLADLRLVLAGETTLAGVQAAMDTWFDTPAGGFETTGYIGGADFLQPITVVEGETLSLDLRADDPALRTMLKHAAMAALATDVTLGFDPLLQQGMMAAAGEGLTFNQTGLVQVRADLGYAEQRVEEARSRISSERTSFQIARTDLLAVDPFETATALEDVQFQLESLYTMTVRLSRLSLTEFLR